MSHSGESSLRAHARSVSAFVGFGSGPILPSSPSPTPPASGSGSSSSSSSAAAAASSTVPCAFKKTFGVSSLKSLNRRQNYVLVLEFEKNLVSFHKVRRGREVKRSFPFHACVKLERETKSTQLTCTFGHEPKYKKSLFFATPDDRELFCNLVHAMIVSGARAVKLFKSLRAMGGGTGGSLGSTNGSAAASAGATPASSPHHQHAATDLDTLSDSGLAFALASGGVSALPIVPDSPAGTATAAGTDFTTPQASPTSATGGISGLPPGLCTPGGVQGMDFCEFLISFSSAQTQTQALTSGGTATGANGQAASTNPGPASPHVPDLSSAGSHDQGNKSAGGSGNFSASGPRSLKFNASTLDPQTSALLSFLNDPNSGISENGTSNLLSLLNGRLIEGERPMNSSDITYRLECPCGGIGTTISYKQSTPACDINAAPANTASNSYGSQSNLNAKEASSQQDNSSQGITASSRGLFLLTNYRILYINYNENTSYATAEARSNYEAYMNSGIKWSLHTNAEAANASPTASPTGSTLNHSGNSAFHASLDPSQPFISAHFQRQPSSSGATSPSSSNSSGASLCTCDSDIPLGLINRVIKSTKSTDSCEMKLLLKDGRKIEFGFDSSTKWVDGLIANINKLAFPKDETKLFAFSYGAIYQTNLLKARESFANTNSFLSTLKASSASSPAATTIGTSSTMRIPPGKSFLQQQQQAAAAAAQNGSNSSSDIVDGWDLYDALQDYGRIGLLSDPLFRVCSNIDFKLCSSYPQWLITPTLMKDDEMKQIATYRSQSRLPAVVWIHPITRATLSRCAQPLVGLKGKRSELDEKLVAVLRTVNPSNSAAIHIIDARPWKAAVGNQAMGRGFENTTNYPGATLQFANIDNIHAIRHALDRLQEVCNFTDQTNTTSSSYYGSTSKKDVTTTTSAFLTSSSSASAAFDESFLSKLEGTLWTHYVRLVLAASQKIAVAMSEEGTSVVTHCSDGWDRTSQLAALTELMLDPFYRTLEGFAILIEKEWCSFGHRFSERYGHASPEYDDSQRAPIFTQFLDCVYQLCHQFPTSYEFNEDYLLAIYDHITSHRFGTFLYNSMADRMKNELKRKTVSLWTYLLHPKIRVKYYNPQYVHPPHVKRWNVKEVLSTQNFTMNMLAKARIAANAQTPTISSTGATVPSGERLPVASPSASAAMRTHGVGTLTAALSNTPIQPLTNSPTASMIASFFCIPSVSAKRIVLWEKLHLRYEREFIRTQAHAQVLIGDRINQEVGKRMWEPVPAPVTVSSPNPSVPAALLPTSAAVALAHKPQPINTASANASGASSVSASAPTSPAVPTTNGTTPKNTSSAAAPSPSLANSNTWMHRYNQLMQRITEAGIDIESLENGAFSLQHQSHPDSTNASATTTAPPSPGGTKSNKRISLSASQMVTLKASIDDIALNAARAGLRVSVERGPSASTAARAAAATTNPGAKRMSLSTVLDAANGIHSSTGSSLNSAPSASPANSHFVHPNHDSFDSTPPSPPTLPATPAIEDPRTDPPSPISRTISDGARQAAIAAVRSVPGGMLRDTPGVRIVLSDLTSRSVGVRSRSPDSPRTVNVNYITDSSDEDN